MKLIYLDYAAATPMDDTAVRAMQPFSQTDFYNPSAVYQASRLVHKKLETARSTVAQAMGVRDQEIIFTAGGTEANNLAIHGVMRRHHGARMVCSSIEHDSVLLPAQSYPHTLIAVDSEGLINLESLKAAITDKTVLVSIMYANNEVGTIQPLSHIAGIIKTVRKQRQKSGNQLPLYFHTDACQAANYLDLNVARLGVDMMTINGGKIYSAKQSGCLYMERHVQMDPLISGGGQEGGRRSGTENIGAIIAFATMLQKVQKKRKNETKRLAELRDLLFANLSQNVPDITYNGSSKRLANNLNISIPGADGERLVMELDEAGIMVATGSACSASSSEPSHVLRAMGYSDSRASSSLRITLGSPTTREDIVQAGTILSQVITKHKRLVY